METLPNQIAEQAIKALTAMLEDYRSEGCPDPKCRVCARSRQAEELARKTIKEIKALAFADHCVGKRIKPEPFPGDQTTYHEKDQDQRAIANFAAAMGEKMERKAMQGRGGWKDPEQCSVNYLADLLIDHVYKGDPVDIGNLAMMLHQRHAPPGTITLAFEKMMRAQNEILHAGREDMLKAIAFAIHEDDKHNAIAFLEAWSEGNHLDEWPEYATFTRES